MYSYSYIYIKWEVLIYTNKLLESFVYGLAVCTYQCAFVNKAQVKVNSGTYSSSFTLISLTQVMCSIMTWLHLISCHEGTLTVNQLLSIEYKLTHKFLSIMWGPLWSWSSTNCWLDTTIALLPEVPCMYVHQITHYGYSGLLINPLSLTHNIASN